VRECDNILVVAFGIYLHPATDVHMADKEQFHFKAATGFGAVVDGSVASSSVAQVGKDLQKQGLIPVRVWSEQVNANRSLWGLIRYAFRAVLARIHPSRPEIS
jgi:hypothetical protein